MWIPFDSIASAGGGVWHLAQPSERLPGRDPGLARALYLHVPDQTHRADAPGPIEEGRMGRLREHDFAEDALLARLERLPTE
jgi:hypothetical protein